MLKKILTTLIGCATLALVIVICYDVIMRYIFSSGSVALQELEWHLFSFIILFGGVVVLIENSHVRVDLIFNSSIYTERTREVVNCIGNLVFLIPFCVIIIWASYPFIYDSFIHSEKITRSRRINQSLDSKVVYPSLVWISCGYRYYADS